MAPTDIQETFGSARDEHQLRPIIEQHFHSIVDRIPGFVCTLKPTGEVESVNRQIVEYFGRSVDDLRQWTMTDAVHPDDLPRAIAGWTRAIEIGERYQI